MVTTYHKKCHNRILFFRNKSANGSNYGGLIRSYRLAGIALLLPPRSADHRENNVNVSL